MHERLSQTALACFVQRRLCRSGWLLWSRRYLDCLIVLLAKAGIIITKSDKFVAMIMPILTVGGVVGFVAGLVVSLSVMKMDAKRKEQIIRRYVGSENRLYIYSGVCS